MKFLLDTCTFLWFINAAPQLPTAVKELIVDPGNEVFLSVISVWETLVKQRIGKLKLPKPASAYLMKQRARHEINSLPLDEPSLGHLAKLPPLHQDPFDRMLICQATEHGLTLITPDQAITAYPVKTLWQ